MSNFFRCRYGVFFKGNIFPSSEHAYVASRLTNAADVEKLKVGGSLASLSGLSTFFTIVDKGTQKNKVVLGRKNVSKEEFEAKCNHWGEENVGIVAKMAHNNPKAAGFVGDILPMDIEAKKRVFFQILESKFSRDTELLRFLVSTKNAYLLEFVRGAIVREKKGGEEERWGGMDVEVAGDEGEKKWEVHGQNLMGELLMAVRESLKEDLLPVNKCV